MDGIPIYYVMQPSVDDTLNVFFLPSNVKSLSDVKINDVVANFPHRNNGKFYHFRFALSDKDQKTWVDISNLNVKAPVIDNRILVKVLELAKPQYTKIFSSLYTGTKTSVPNGREQGVPQQSQQQPQRPAQTDNRPKQQPQSQPQSQQPQYQSRPAQSPTPQKQASGSSNTPSARTQIPDDFDLLGGGDVINMSSSTTQAPKMTASFSSPSHSNKPDNSALHGMSREQIGAYKQQQMDQAIQEKKDFAKKLWAEEEKTNNEKDRAYVEVEEIIKKWSGKDGQRNNIRALLCTLQDVVWAESGWVSLSFSDLMQPAQIKKNYFKAITRFHPDKNQAADYRQKYISERVTNELNAAWDEFRKTNP